MKVTLFGLGIMGSGIASNLLKHGFDLTIYNRTREKAVAFADQGAKIAHTPREAAQNADVIISMVGDDQASREIWLGDNGGLNGIKPGTVIVESSTLSPNWIQELAQLTREHGGTFLDAPVTGSKQAAAEGQLTMLIGGSVDDVENVRPVFEAISQRQVHLGGVGAGATWKLINNMMVSVHIAALAEALALAEAAGIDLKQVEALIGNSAVSSPIVKGKLPFMLERDYDNPSFALKWMRKDASYATQLAADYGIDVATVEAAARVFETAEAQGLGDQDFAAVVEVVRSKTGVE
jgi:3-hydroxyisobutyrate dehydrogenase